ncbi:MAG: HAD-IIIC family phosphatase [Candidatus Solibacter sp.]
MAAAGKLAYRLKQDWRWRRPQYALMDRLTKRLHRGTHDRQTPSAFLLEIYNPSSAPVSVQVGFVADTTTRTADLCNVSLNPPVIRTVVLTPGYNREIIEWRFIQSVAGTGKPFDIRILPEGDQNSRLVFLSADFVLWDEAPIRKDQPAKDVKCIVWDLDNTVWDGTLVETENVRLKPGIAKTLKHFDERGILLSIASKNDFAPAWRKLEEFGIAEYFLYPEIDWAPKSTAVRRIAERLNIGLDTFAFIDDNPFEREEVGRVNPQVRCIDATEAGTLAGREGFQGSTSAEARQRRRFYRDAIQRESVEKQYGSDYKGFLASCSIVLEVNHYTSADFDRVAELVQRTNQLNFSGRKYSREQLRSILDDATLDKLVLRSSDKFGDYGTVGFGIVRHQDDAIEILDFMLSCRVQSKSIEEAFFGHLRHTYPHDTPLPIKVNFVATDRNTPARRVLDDLGFCAIEGDAGRGLVLPKDQPLGAAYVEIRSSITASRT